MKKNNQHLFVTSGYFLAAAILLHGCASQPANNQAEVYGRFTSYPIPQAVGMDDKVIYFEGAHKMDINLLRRAVLDKIKSDLEANIGSLPESKVEVGSFNNALQGIAALGSNASQVEYKTSYKIDIEEPTVMVAPATVTVSFINGEYEYTNNRRTVMKAEGIQKATYTITFITIGSSQVRISMPRVYQAQKARRGAGTPVMQPLFDDAEAQQRFMGLFNQITLTDETIKTVLAGIGNANKGHNAGVTKQSSDDYVAPDMTELNNLTFPYHYMAFAGIDVGLKKEIIYDQFPNVRFANDEFEKQRNYQSADSEIEKNIATARTINGELVLAYDYNLPIYDFNKKAFSFNLPARHVSRQNSLDMDGRKPVDQWYVVLPSPKKSIDLDMDPASAEQLIKNGERKVNLQIRIKLKNPKNGIVQGWKPIRVFHFDADILEVMITTRDGTTLKKYAANDFF